MAFLDLVFHWIGPILVVVSLAVPNVLWFRYLNLTGSLLAALTSLIDGLWPFVFMNSAIAIINIIWLWKIYQKRAAGHLSALAVVGPDPTMAQMWGKEVEQEVAAALKANRDSVLALLVHDKETLAAVVLAPSSSGERVVWTNAKEKALNKEVHELAAAL